MKRYVKFVPWIVMIACVAVIVFLMWGCGATNPQVESAWQHAEQVRLQITADGVITPEEQAAYLAALESWAGKANASFQSTDWGAIIGTGLASVITAVFGTNWLRNRNIPGTVRKAP